ncbi:MAG TPA: hypothetical protein VNV66_07820 [Pilimelia sp.]|nr:hypothetical protein [Pilimelia sp.]
MVHVRLAQEWVDDNGRSHPAGNEVDVDAGTLAELEQRGVVVGAIEGEELTVPGKRPAEGQDGWAGPGDVRP